ncbi:MAG: hypothetical protein II194_04765 [Bacteroidales bacterium]|nr:hypothetical protein [Bacteroidales bacterium]
MGIFTHTSLTPSSINEGTCFELYILKGDVVIGDVPPPASTKGLVLNFIFRKNVSIVGGDVPPPARGVPSKRAGVTVNNAHIFSYSINSKPVPRIP